MTQSIFNVRAFRPALTLTCLGLAALFSSAAHAQLVIIPTFDSSITSAPNAAAIEAAINDCIAFYHTTYANSVTVHIAFKADETIGLGQSSTYGDDTTYTNYYNKIVANAALANDTTALTAYLLIAPVNGANPVNGSQMIHLTTALDRAIGLNASGDTPLDSTISLKMSLMNITRTNIDPNKYDLRETVYHELNEALGFGSALNNLMNGAPAPTGAIGPADLFRYDANGSRSFNTTANTKAYFSLNGTTHLERFNQTAGGDFHDFYSDGSNGPAEFAPAVQDAFGMPGGFTNMGPAEMTGLEVIGYTPKAVVTPAPVTGSIALESVTDLSTVSQYAPLGTFHIVLRTAGTAVVIKTADVTLTTTAGSPKGAYSITGVPAGVYDVLIKGGKNLAVLSRNVVVGATGGAVPAVTLPAGDSNNDNSVDSTDFGTLIGAFGGAGSVTGSGYDATVDFNFDGSVDSTDFGILIGEFNSMGAN